MIELDDLSNSVSLKLQFIIIFLLSQPLLMTSFACVSDFIQRFHVLYHKIKMNRKRIISDFLSCSRILRRFAGKSTTVIYFLKQSKSLLER